MYKQTKIYCDINFASPVVQHLRQSDINITKTRTSVLLTDKYQHFDKNTYTGKIYIVTNNNRRIIRCFKHINSPTMIICIGCDKLISKILNKIRHTRTPHNTEILYKSDFNNPCLGQDIIRFVNRINWKK